MVSAASARFSVIIPAYQAARTIRRAVQSALAQDVPAASLEVIVCDDGSTDGTADRLRDLAAVDRRLRLVRQPNKGVSAASNRAAREASGEFLVKLDADDEWLPGRLRAIAELSARQPEIDIITTDAEVVNLDGSRYRYYERKAPFPPLEEQSLAVLERNFLFGSAAVRRYTFERAGGFREDVAYQEEYECWIRMIVSGSRAALVPRPLATYHRRRGSLSANRCGLAETIDQTLRTLPPEWLSARQRSAIARRRLELAPVRMRDRRLAESAKDESSKAVAAHGAGAV